MRAALLVFALSVGAALVLSAAQAAPGGAPATGADPAIVAVQGPPVCPPGTRYVPGGYDRKGKWRDARCSRK